jgi:DhnA family fructose-bisphosphate aldolase class Ia
MEYTSESYQFDLHRFFPRSLFDQICEVRVQSPEVILQTALARKRRTRLTSDGKFTLLAADHPGRGVTRLADDPFGMANRYEYLGRVLRVLVASDFDGFMGTPDMIEDLLILEYLAQEQGGESFLDGRVLVGCMQRGGVAGVQGEIDDRFGSYSAASIQRFNLDGGKMMFRFVPADERTLWTIDYCSRAINELVQRDLVPFVEPLRMDWEGGAWVMKNTAAELVKLVGVISALGETSSRTWMKLPYCQDFERVAQATTLPILMLGGDTLGNPEPIYRTFSAGMASGSNVRGVMVGRNVLYPGPDDPAAVASAVHRIVHAGISSGEAVEATMDQRGNKMDLLRELFG